MSKDFKPLIQAGENTLMSAWVELVRERGGLNSSVELLATALDLIRDARAAVDYPWLTRVSCVITGGEIHALGRGYAAVCGATPDPHQTVLHAKRVPTCPLCIEMLKPKGT